MSRYPLALAVTLLAGGAFLAALGVGPAFAQGSPQVVSLMQVDPASLAAGYRASKLVGSTVVNGANDTVGKIDDLIITPNDRVPYAVLSVGGFLGMDTKYVVVSFSAFQVKDRQMVLPGATRDSLTALPAFKYHSGS